MSQADTLLSSAYRQMREGREDVNKVKSTGRRWIAPRTNKHVQKSLKQAYALRRSTQFDQRVDHETQPIQSERVFLTQRPPQFSSSARPEAHSAKDQFSSVSHSTKRGLPNRPQIEDPYTPAAVALGLRRADNESLTKPSDPYTPASIALGTARRRDEIESTVSPNESQGRLTNEPGEDSTTDKALNRWKASQLNDILAGVQTKSLLQSNERISVGLEDLIARSIINSKRIRIERIRPIEDRQFVYEEFGQFDWVSFLQAQWQDRNRPLQFSDESASSISAIENKYQSVTSGYRKQTTTGGTLELSHSIANEQDNSGFRLNPAQTVADVSISFSQELLQGAGKDIVLSNALLADYFADSTHGDSVGIINQQVQAIVQQYWALYRARGEFMIQFALIDTAQDILSQLKSRKRIDAQENIIAQAESLLLEARADLRNAKTQLLIEQDNLIRLVNDPTLSVHNLEIITSESPVDGVCRFDRDVEIALALHNRPELAARVADIRAAAVQHHVSLNQLLPRLTFSLDSSVRGLSGNKRDPIDALDNIGETDPTIEGGLNLEFFIQNRTARAAARRNKLAIQRLQLEYEDEIASITLDVSSAIRQLNGACEILDLRTKTLQQRRRELDYLTLRREVIPREGASTSLLLEQYFLAVNRLVNSQQAYVQALTVQQASLIDLQRAKGMLVHLNEIPQNARMRTPSRIEGARGQHQNRRSYKQQIESRVLSRMPNYQ